MLMRFSSVATCCLLLNVTALAQTGVDFRDAIKSTTSSTVAVMLDADAAPSTIRYQLRKNGEVNAPHVQWMLRSAMFADQSIPMRSGFAVAPDLVISCELPQSSQEVDLVTYDGRKVKGRVVVRDHVTGLVAIRIDDGSLSPLAVAAESPQAGLPVLISWLQGGKTVTSEASMIATDPNSDESDLGYSQKLNVDFAPQKLGAPIVDGNATVVGVLVSKSGKSISLPATHVARLIEAASAETPSDLLRGRLGIQLKDGPEVNGVAMIAGVMDDMPAKEAELEAGDRVTKVGDRLAKSHLDVMAAVAMSRAGDEITLEIRRGDETLERTLKLSSDGPAPSRIRYAPGLPRPTQQLFQLKDGTLVPISKDGVFKLPQQRAFLYGNLQAERSKMEQSLKKLETENARLKEIVEAIKEQLKSQESE